jgi:formylmethanofuran dehydrogenase subunit E
MRYPMTVCGRSFEDFLNTIERFHGWKAPGVVIGGFMVDLAQSHIAPDVETDAIVETAHCIFLNFCSLKLYELAKISAACRRIT